MNVTLQEVGPTGGSGVGHRPCQCKRALMRTRSRTEYSKPHQDRTVTSPHHRPLFVKIARGFYWPGRESRHVPGTPLSSCSPWSTKSIPEPVTADTTESVTRIVPGLAVAATREAM